MNPHVLEWLGTAGNITGAILVAHKQRNGFYLFLASNAAYITFGLLTQCYGIVRMPIYICESNLEADCRKSGGNFRALLARH